VPDGIEKFSDLKLVDVLAMNVQLAGYEKPTPVQKHAIPIALKGRDLMACAQTGSGKTAAFLLPMIQFLLTTELPDPPAAPSKFGRRQKVYPYALVLGPTRELVVQIYEEALKVCRHGLVSKLLTLCSNSFPIGRACGLS